MINRIYKIGMMGAGRIGKILYSAFGGICGAVQDWNNGVLVYGGMVEGIIEIRG